MATSLPAGNAGAVAATGIECTSAPVSAEGEPIENPLCPLCLGLLQLEQSTRASSVSHAELEQACKQHAGGTAPAAAFEKLGQVSAEQVLRCIQASGHVVEQLGLRVLVRTVPKVNPTGQACAISALLAQLRAGMTRLKHTGLTPATVFAYIVVL